MTRDRWLILTLTLLVATSVVLRYFSIPYSNDDMNVHNLVWYKTIVTQGGWNALGTAFTNYSPPYSYFLVFASLFKDFIAPLTVIKLIPITFDILGAVLVYKIVRTCYESKNIPLLAATIYFTAPTVILNSSYWGQVDSIYTFFIVASVYLLITQRYTLAWISFGTSFAIKAQAIFIAPLFLILLLQKRIRWSGLLWVPAIYFLSALPTILLGRPAFDVLTVYITQSGTYETLSRNAPNLYIFFPQSWYSIVLPISALLAGGIITAWVVFSAKYLPSSISNKNIMLTALLSVSLMPFLLPKMHDRYFYPADTLSIVVAFLEPKLWFIPLLFQAVSLPGYAAFLFDSNQTLVYSAALLNTLTIGFLLKRQNMGKQGHLNLKIKRILSILLTLVIPIILIGAGIRSIFTPVFIRAESFLFKNQAEDKKSEQYQRDIYVTEYITNNKGENYLRQLLDEQGNPVLGKVDRQTLNAIRSITTVVFDIWHISLLTLLVTGVLFWVYGSSSTFINATRMGAKLSLWVSPVIGLLVASFTLNDNSPYRIVEEVAVGIFSAKFWSIASVWIVGTTFLIGLLVVLLLRKNRIINNV